MPARAAMQKRWSDGLRPALRLCSMQSATGTPWRPAMASQITIPIDDETFDRACAAAAERGMSMEAYWTDLVRDHLPLAPPPIKCDVSSIIGIGTSGEPTDIAREKGKLIGEAVWHE